MDTRVIMAFSHVCFLFLLINHIYAEERTADPSFTKDNVDVDKNYPETSTRLWDVEFDDTDHIRHTRDLKQIKSLKLRLEWFDKSTDALVGSEHSRDLGDDGTVIEQLGLSIVNNVNNGGYDVQPAWVGILQNYFNHRINLAAFDYQVSFDYREWWEDMRVISFELFHSPSWRKENGNIYANLTPNVSGEIVRAVYTYIGHNDPSTVMRLFLLGTSIDVRLNFPGDIEFFPTQKQLVNGQAFQVSHSTHALKTNHHRYSIGKPLMVKFTLTVRVKT